MNSDNSNPLWLLGEKSVRLALGLGVSFAVARYLGPDQFGEFAVLQSVVLLLSAVANYGQESVLVRDVLKANSDREEQEVVSKIIVWRMILGVSIQVAIIALTVSLHKNESLLFLAFLGFALIFPGYTIPEAYLQARLKGKKIFKASFLALGVAAIFKIAVIFFDWGLKGIVLAFSLELCVLALIYYREMSVEINNSNFFKPLHFELEPFKSHLKECLPLVLAGVVAIGYMRLDQFMLAYMMGSESTGLYVAATKVTEMFYMAPIVITAAFVPIAINHSKVDDAEYRKAIASLYSLVIWFGITAGSLLWLADTHIVAILYGEGFGQAAEVLAVYAWSLVFVGLGVVYGKKLVIESRSKLTLHRTLLGFLMNAVLNFLLIPNYGIVGAAAATLASQAYANILHDFISKKTRQDGIEKIKGLFLMPTSALQTLNPRA